MATKTDAGSVTKTSAQAGKTGKTAKAGKAPQIVTQAAQTAAKTARGTRSAAKLKAERGLTTEALAQRCGAIVYLVADQPLLRV